MGCTRLGSQTSAVFTGASSFSKCQVEKKERTKRKKRKKEVEEIEGLVRLVMPVLMVSLVGPTIPVSCPSW